MEELQLFEYRKKQVRTTFVDGQIWLVAKDVCDVLDLIWKGDAATLPAIKPEWKRSLEIPDPNGRKQPTICIAEAAVYKLAFRSNKPEAERFTDWIAEEVIPQIRKTGRYVARSGILPLEMHTHQGVQKEMSKAVNGYQFYRGGKLAIIRYNVANCLTHTGKVPTRIKAEGKAAKLRAKDCQSAKEVIRRLQPEKACCMSLADNLVEQGHDAEKVFKVTPKAAEVFQGMLELGATPAELKR